jgi:alanine racemase
MPRPIRAVVDLAAARHNLAVLRAAAPSAKVMAVLKADAYGLGLANVLPAVAGADGIAVLDVAAAAQVRASGFGGAVLLLNGAWSAADLRDAAELDAAVVVHDPTHLALLDATALARPVSVWLELDSGMRRLGLAPPAFRDAYASLSGHPRVREIVAMTHFAGADTGDAIDAQRGLFASATAGWPVARSLCNSAAVFDVPAAHADWVRPGIALYGASPFADRTAASLGLRPAMTLLARIVATRDLSPGDAVGYGGTFVAPAPMRAGTVACGYADGYPRLAGTGTPVAIDGVRTRVLGRVSMDLIVVDLTGFDADAVGVGAEVELWGPQVPVDEVARHAGTIGYELLAGRAARVPVEVVDRGTGGPAS